MRPLSSPRSRRADRSVISLLIVLIVGPIVSGVRPAALSAARRPSIQDAALPELTQPVNDFAHVIDASSAAAMDGMIRQLQTASGDVVVVATVRTIEPYGDIREYANKLFENHGRGIG